jgi:hypothetical protein
MDTTPRATLVRRKAGISEQCPLRFVRSCSGAAQRPVGRGGRATLWPQRAAGDADRVTVRAAEHPVRHKANESRRDVYGIPARE